MKFPLLSFTEFMYIGDEYALELKAFYSLSVWDGTVSGNQCRDLYQLTVEQVHTVREVLRNRLSEHFPDLVAMCCNMSREQVMNSPAHEVYRAIDKIISDAERLQKLEASKLRSNPDPTYQQAAGDKLDEFGFYNWLDALTNNDRTKWEWAKKLSYRESFVILHKQVIEREIQQEYNRLSRIRNKGR